MSESFIDLIPVLVAAGIAGFIAFLVFLAVREARKARQRVEELATQLGLPLEPRKVMLGIPYGLPRATGIWRGWRAELHGYTTGSGKTQRTWSTFAVYPRSAPGGFTFKMQPRSFSTRVREWFGAKKLTTGDRGFDEAFFVQTNQPEIFRAALLPEIQTRMVEAKHAGANGTFELNVGILKYTELGTFTAKRTARFATLTDVVGSLATIAETIGGT